jgi:hypothetical protein
LALKVERWREGIILKRKHMMRKLPYLVAAVAISGLALSAGPGSASPLAGGLANGSVTELNEGLVHKVHRWHCRARKGWYRGKYRWHRHRRACRDYDDYYYPRPGISFYFYDDDDGRRGKRTRKGDDDK